MPLLSFPTELLEGIASHLRTKFWDDPETSIQAGSSIALVCRRLYSIGGALRWRSIALQSSSAPALAAHFASYPHLAALVRDLTCQEVENGHHVEMERPDREEMVAVLERTRALKGFRLASKTAEGLEEIIEAAGKLLHLKELDIYVQEGLIWTSRFTSAFINGYSSLIDFALSAPSVTLPNTGIATRTSHYPLCRLTTLQLSWGLPQTGPPFLLDSVSKIFDLSSLSLFFVNSLGLARSALFMQLPSLQRLSNLQIDFSPGLISHQLPELIAYLPEMKALEIVSVRTATGVATDSPVSLSTLLRSLPSSIKFATFKALRFNETLSSMPKRWLPVNRNDAVVVGLTLVEGSNDSVQITWMDKSQRKIYRFIDNYEGYEMTKLRWPEFFQ